MAADQEGLAAQEAAEAARRAAGKLGLQVLEKQVREHCSVLTCCGTKRCLLGAHLLVGAAGEFAHSRRLHVKSIPPL